MRHKRPWAKPSALSGSGTCNRMIRELHEVGMRDVAVSDVDFASAATCLSKAACGPHYASWMKRLLPRATTLILTVLGWPYPD
jgi:hypothetical protein